MASTFSSTSSFISFGNHGSDINCEDISSTGRFLLTGGLDGVVKLWSTELPSLKGRVQSSLPSDSPVSALGWSLNESVIVSGSVIGMVKLWDVVTPQEIGRIKTQQFSHN